MHRSPAILLVLLLLLVPLQFASAGMEAYWVQSAGVGTSQGDYHPNTCQVDEGAAGTEGLLHADCGFCQILASAVLLDFPLRRGRAARSRRSAPLRTSRHRLWSPPLPPP